VQVIIILVYRKIKTPFFMEYWELDLHRQDVKKEREKIKRKDKTVENWVQLYQLTLLPSK
jgi:hypothetical protein